MSKIKVGINGFGRIGSLAFRILNQRDDVQVVAINGLQDPAHMLYGLKFDSVHGRFKGEAEIVDNDIIVNGERIKITNERDPEKLDWRASGAEYVIESTGKFLTKETASAHLRAGAKKVILSAPSKDDTPMYVMGVNHKDLKKETEILSCASCTTNCLAPLAKVINDHFGIEEGLMTTIHAATASQMTVDGSVSKFRIGRSALLNIIPSTTGAAKAVGKVIPELDGKLTGMAYRVPVANVSAVDLTVKLSKPTTYEEICDVIRKESEGEMKGYLGYTEEMVVSQDFVGMTIPSVFDRHAGIMLNPTFVKLVAWYDNEMGYAAKLAELTVYAANL